MLVERVPMATAREEDILGLIEQNPLVSQREIAEKFGITRSSVAVHISNLMKKGYIQGRGYVLQRTSYIAVVGSCVLDIRGTPFAPLITQDSNPGAVRLSPGGVGRNIAHNLALLGAGVKLVTLFGDDPNAALLAESCRKAGIDISAAPTVPGGSTAVYLFITDEAGEMQVAVSDMGLYEHITPAFLQSRMELINNASLCITDTNLPNEALAYLAKHCKVPLFADTVSTTKAKKLAGLLPYIHTLKPNRIEASLLSGIEITGDESLAAAAGRLLQMGLQRVFISLSGAGVYAADKTQRLRLPVYPGPVVNTTGAGDSFMAALAFAHQQGCTLAQTARAGLAAAALCIAGDATISPAISAKNVALVQKGQYPFST